MGVHCEISLFKPMTGVYKSGTIVSGSIKYSVDKVTEFTRIIVSLKGISLLRVCETRYVNKGSRTFTYVNNEVIIDNDIVVKGENYTMNIGSEELHFHFKLPVNIPPSFKYLKLQGFEHLQCITFYYVRIKFDKAGMFKGVKSFKKEIPVVSGILPILSREPKICGAKKILTNMFSCKNHVVNLKAVIQDSVIEAGGKVSLSCEVQNLTNIKIKALEVKLLEVYKFKKTNNCETHIVEYVPNTDTKIDSIKIGEEKTFDFVIDVPSNRVSLEHSQIISRKYFVGILAKLPFPHGDLSLAIPLQIGDILECEMHLVPTLMVSKVNVDFEGASTSKGPPMYWEAMREESPDIYENLDEGK